MSNIRSEALVTRFTKVHVRGSLKAEVVCLWERMYCLSAVFNW